MAHDEPVKENLSVIRERALQNYNRARDLSQRIDNKDTADLIVKLCELAIKDFGGSDPEKEIELDRIKQLAAQQFPNSISSLAKQAEAWFLYRIVSSVPPRMRGPVLLLIGIMILVVPLAVKFWGPISRVFGSTQEFSVGCPLPSFTGVHDTMIDNSCGNKGQSSDPAKEAENEVKNNFCAATQPLQKVTYQQLIDLQKDSASMPPLPPDRSSLKKMQAGPGEGAYVSYVAVFKDALYSDLGGEPVNCNKADYEAADIRIVLLNNPDDDECKSTIAEISPHHRPSFWTPDNINRALAGRIVRVQGHLFFDGSGKLCPTPGLLKRASLWEVHPVYSLMACEMNNLEACRNSTNPADWVPWEQNLSSKLIQKSRFPEGVLQ